MNCIYRMAMIALMSLVLVSAPAVAGEKSIYFAKATQSDVEDIVALSSDPDEVLAEKDLLVVFPPAHRKVMIGSAVKKGRMFVARDVKTNELLAFQKIFVYPQEAQAELFSTMTDEIRCIGQADNLALSAIISTKGIEDLKKLEGHEYAKEDVYIYIGGSYTKKSARRKGINTALTQFALAVMLPEAKALAVANKAEHVVFLFGLTVANAIDGEKSRDRTPQIFASILDFIAEMGVIAEVKHFRYKAVKPTFADTCNCKPGSAPCAPLADDKGVAGFGCTLVVRIR